ncbi:MAG: hypothetical protein HY716_15105 [Planctomycetes bacterium]|nr:hypothetical protein [Planctomycetota bacterium]
MILTCEMCRSMALDFVEGDLVDRDAGRVRDHVCSCVPCADAVEVIRHQSRLLRAVPRPAPPPGLAARIGVSVARPFCVPERRTSRTAGWLAAAAAGALLALGALQLKPPAPSSPPVRDIRVVDVPFHGGPAALGRLTPGFEPSQAGVVDLLVSGDRP